MALEFTEDFEGTLAAWTLTGAPTIDSTAAIHGTGGLLITGAGAKYASRVPSPATPTVLVDRLYVRVPTGGFPTGADATIWIARTAIPTTFRVKINITTGNLSAQIGSGTIQTFGALTAGSIYYVDVRANSTAGTIDWAVNGTAQTQVTGTTGSTFSSIRVGNENGGVTAMTIHIDDVAQSQTTGDYPIGALVGGGTGITPLGMSARGFSNVSSVADHAAHSWMNMWSVWIPWSYQNPSRASYTYTNLDASINDAEANNYKIIIRVIAGGQSPAWIYTDGTNPVAKIHLYQAGDAGQDCPVPWDANLRVLWRLMLADLKTHLDGNTTGGHPRRNYVAWMAVSMPAHPGTEMWTVDEVDDSRNLAVWDAVSTGATSALKLADRTSKLQTAWDNAIDDMPTYISTVRPCLAGGAIFQDGQSKAKAIPAAKVGAQPTLIIMETNAQPKGNVNSGSAYVTGTWKSWCAGCHQVLANAIAVGLDVGMQTAGDSAFARFTLSGWTPTLAYQYMARDMIGILKTTDPGYPGFDYPLIFLEPSPATLTKNEAYSRDVAQPAIMAQGAVGSNTGPPDGTVISGPVSTTASYFAEVAWTDPDGVATAEISQDAQATWQSMIFSAVTGNWGLTITLSSGVDTLYFRATDANASALTATPIAYTVTYSAAPTNTAVPTLSPTSPVVGQAVTSSTGTWTGTPNAYTYLWERKLGAGSYTTVQTGTLETYVPSSGDVGYVLRSTVTANNGQDSAPASSADSSAVALSVTTGTGKIPTPIS